MNGPAAMKLLLDDGTEISGRAFGAAHQPSAVPRPNRLTSEKCHKRTHALQTRKHDDRKRARRRRQHIRRIQHRECDDASERRRYQRQLLHHLPPDRKSDQRRRIMDQWRSNGSWLAGPMCRRPPAFPSAPALSTRAPTYTPIRPQFSKMHGRKTSKYKQPSKFAALSVGPAAKKWNSSYA